MQKKRILFFGAAALAAVLFVNRVAQQNRAALTSSVYTVQTGVVILDAGHGGMDGGATAADGTPEKEINLAVVRHLDALLHAAGIRTVLTRTDDGSIHDPQYTSVQQQKISDIHNRLAIMQQTEHGIFVSIHQNHFSQSKYSGTQVFYSSNHPGSVLLAEDIRSAVVEWIQPQNTRELKKATDSIFLLTHTTTPAVLVECGFLSNEEERNKLKTPAYQQQLAFAIMAGYWKYQTQ